MRTYLATLAIFIILAFTACSKNADTTDTDIGYRETNASGVYTDMSESRRRIEIINTQQDFLSSLSLYDQHGLSDNFIYGIDFTAEQVVMISLGKAGLGKDIDLVSIKEFPDAIKLKYALTRPCAGCADDTLTRFPMKVVVIESQKFITIEEQLKIVNPPTVIVEQD